MIASAPHYLLFSESTPDEQPAPADGNPERTGRWRFVLEKVDGSVRFEADDRESVRDDSRLELLAVVRGLEALNEPSRVTLVTPSRYVSRGIRYGLEQWRENDWCWERFGEMAPVRNRDLWQRVDRAMKYHRVDCRVWRFDFPESRVPAPRSIKRRPGRQQPKRRARNRPRSSPLQLPFRVARAFIKRCIASFAPAHGSCRIGLGAE